MKFERIVLLISFSMHCILTGCVELDDTRNLYPVDDPDAPATGLSIKKINTGIDNFYSLGGINHTGQGFAVFKGVAYRLYNSGLCQTYDIKDLSAPVRISSFPLGSNRPDNHSNCAQFGIDAQGDPLLYVSGLSGRCFVERICPDGSELVQTLTLPALEVFNISSTMNIICGGDGCLWAFGSALSGQALTFAKLRRPDATEGDISLTGEDILDYWTEEGYNYAESVWQGGMVYDGLLYFVFGTNESKRHLAIYDTATHEKIADIDLHNVIPEEPEDCDLVDGKILLTINGGTGYYIITHQKNNE